MGSVNTLLSEVNQLLPLESLKFKMVPKIAGITDCECQLKQLMRLYCIQS